MLRNKPSPSLTTHKVRKNTSTKRHLSTSTLKTTKHPNNPKKDKPNQNPTSSPYFTSTQTYLTTVKPSSQIPISKHYNDAHEINLSPAGLKLLNPRQLHPTHQPSSASQTYPKKHEQKGVDIKINTDKRPLTLTHTAAAAGHDQLNNKHPTPKDFKIIKTQHPKQTPTPSMNPNGPPPSQLMHHAYNQHVNSNSPHHHAHQNNNFTPDWRSTKPCRFGADCYKPQCPFQHPTS